MTTAISNNLRSITLLIKEKDLIPVRSLLNFLKEKFPRFSVNKFRTGKIGEDILISFKVTSEYYPKVVEKFAYNDIPIIMKDKASLELVVVKKEEKRRKLRVQGWSEISVNRRQISLTELQKLSDQGKLKEVVKEAKGGVSSNIEIVKKAKKILGRTINIAIENIIQYSEEIVSKRQESINQLLLIATDKDLKLFQKFEDMKRAGLAAIDIALSHKQYNSNLIQIANNPKLDNSTNIKAAIALSEILFANTEDEDESLSTVIKLLNTRWLKIAFETIQQNLSEDEIESIKNLIEFIHDKRKAA